MTKSALVKIGVPSGQAESMRQLRRVRQILEQHDAAIARLNAATEERIREAVHGDTTADESTTGYGGESGEPGDAAKVTANAPESGRVQ